MSRAEIGQIGPLAEHERATIGNEKQNENKVSQVINLARYTYR